MKLHGPMSSLLCGCQVAKRTSPLYCLMTSILSPFKSNWLLYVARHKCRHTDLGYVPLLDAMAPGSLSADRTVGSYRCVQFCEDIESFPGGTVSS
jgi:hypothetical protein